MNTSGKLQGATPASHSSAPKNRVPTAWCRASAGRLSARAAALTSAEAGSGAVWAAAGAVAAGLGDAGGLPVPGTAWCWPCSATLSALGEVLLRHLAIVPIVTIQTKKPLMFQSHAAAPAVSVSVEMAQLVQATAN